MRASTRSDPSGSGREVPDSHRTAVLTIMVNGEHPGEKFDLRAGERLPFGSCDCSQCGNRLLLSARLDLWFQAALTAHDNAWTATNLSPDLDLWCSDLEEPKRTIRVRPGRAEMFIPFEFTGLEVRLRGRTISQRMTVIGPEPQSAAPGGPCAKADRYLSLGLRSGTACIAILKELGRAEGGELPTSTEISRRLSMQGFSLSRKAVDHQIEYLCERIFPGMDGVTVERGLRRMALATVAERASLV